MQTLTTEHLSQLLFIDDEHSFHRYVSRHLDSRRYQVVTSDRWDEARTLLDERKVRPAIVFIDPLSNGKSLEYFEDFCAGMKDIPVVVISALRDPRSIARAIQSGARGYLCKPFEIKELYRTIDEVIHTSSIPKEIAPVTVKVESQTSQNGFLFCNAKMKQIHETIVQIANAKVSVLLLGETGVGKDVIARAIHQQSSLRNRPFVKVNCAAMPAELMESELFGCEKGAFTGAYVDRPGKFEFANRGTIFLDEIAEFTPSAQAKLLQVLQDGKFTRLGSNQEVEVDVRVIAATNRNLEEALERGTFREDLYYRLSVVSIEIPPLRMRKDEIELYCGHFLEKMSQQYGTVKELPESLIELFKAYPWPGNVRELENLVKRYVILQDEESIRAQLEPKISRQAADQIDEMTDAYLNENNGNLDLKEIGRKAALVVEKNMITKTLLKTNWNKSKAAKELKVSYKTLLTKIGLYDIKPR